MAAAGDFFVLPAADVPDNLFGQPALEEEKLPFLADSGMEVGTHACGTPTSPSPPPHRSESWQGDRYELEGAADVTGGASFPPGDRRFDPYRVPRVRTGALELQSRGAFRYFEAHPEERYVSDGDPQTVSFPEGAGATLDRQAVIEAGRTPREYRDSPPR